MDKPAISAFPHTSKAQWLDAVRRELKGEDYETMLIEIDGMSFDPYYAREEARYFQGTYPRFNPVMRAGENFRSGTATFAADLEQSLDQNMLAPLIELEEPGNEAEIKKAVKGKCSPLIMSASIEALSQLKTVLNDPKAIFIYRGEEMQTGYWYPLSIDLSQTVEENAVRLFELLTDSNHPQGIFAELRLTGDLIRDVAKMRAYKVLWYNWLEKKNCNLPLYISAVRKPVTPFPENAIEQTVLIIIAELCQADRIDLDLQHTSGQEKSTLRHAFNVLSIESGIGHITDPAGGSYLWEYISTELARNAWSNYAARQGA